MKAILKFDLPEEQHDFDTALNGAAFLSALNSILSDMRSQIKYHKSVTPNTDQLTDHIISLLEQGKIYLHVDHQKQLRHEIDEFVRTLTDWVSLYDYREHLFKQVIDSSVVEKL